MLYMYGYGGSSLQPESGVKYKRIDLSMFLFLFNFMTTSIQPYVQTKENRISLTDRSRTFFYPNHSPQSQLCNVLEVILILQPWYIAHQSAFRRMLPMQSSKLCSCLNTIVFGISTKTGQKQPFQPQQKQLPLISKKERLKFNNHCMLGIAQRVCQCHAILRT